MVNMNSQAPAVSLATLANKAQLRRDIEAALGERAFRSDCQVIVSLTSGLELGYEALTRPAGAAPLNAPDRFLAAAGEVGLLTETDHAWRQASLERLGPQLLAEKLLFLNVTPASLQAGRLTALNLERAARENGLVPEQVVIEVTEGESIDDFGRMRGVLGGFRGRGFLLAIDDAGAGPSSLQSIVELRPDFIKLDRWLSRDIAFDRSRRSMVEALVQFAGRVHARVIAEGIETGEQLEAFIGLGVAFGQGYYLGLPGPRPMGPDRAIQSQIRKAAGSRRREVPAPGRAQVGDLVEVTPTTPARAAGTEVYELFQANRHLQVLAVLRPGGVAGIITRGRLFERMSGQFGLSLNGRRTAEQLCTPAITVQATTVVQEAARMALDRPATTLHDPIVVLEGKDYAGIVNTTGLLEQLLAEEVAEARLVSPLTGLPGNRLIRRKVEALRASGDPYVLVYADIDHFKSFNDRFGFGHGDEAIAGLAAVLVEAAEGCPRESFVGHVGGDDFVAIIHARDFGTFEGALAEKLSRRWFDGGGRLAVDRVTVSVGGLPLGGPDGPAYEELGALVATAKRNLKSRGGDCIALFDGWTTGGSEVAGMVA